jgi:secreted trypsin-like serine protease
MCGGSLIDPNGNSGESNLVLTAAHCVMNEDGSQRFGAEGFTVTLGAQDISNPDEETQIRMKVEAVYPHESYDPTNILNDVAILKLASPVQFSEYVQPICLPTEGQQPEDPNQCYAVGWGRISNDNSTTADVLQQTLLPVLPDSDCSSSEVWASTYNSDVMLCAGYLNGAKSTCQGDSGGPLVCQDGGHFTLFGSTSFGNGELGENGLPQCASANKPAVFARTSSFLSWIQEKASSM